MVSLVFSFSTLHGDMRPFVGLKAHLLLPSFGLKAHQKKNVFKYSF